MGMAAAYMSVMMELNSKQDLFSIDEKYLKTLYLSKTAHGRMLLECTFLMLLDHDKTIETVKVYSNHLAIAGQLKNDIYDFTKHKQYRGLSDLKQGHITWPLYLLIKSLTWKERKKFLRDLKDKDYESLILLFREKKIIEEVLKLIDFHVATAKTVIKNKFPKRVETILETWAEGNRHFSREPKL